MKVKTFSKSQCSRLVRLVVQKKLLCVIQFHFLYVPVSTYYKIQSVIVMQQSASQTRACTLIMNFRAENAFNA